jgi:rhodanese-related sulfurtransferase
MPPAPPRDWNGLARWLAQWYPEVRNLPVAALAAWLADASRAPPLIVDIRSAEEQAVSTLPGAVCATTSREAMRFLARQDRGQPVVVYCAVGVRSARLASTLQRAGCTDVHNLERSIFGWANAGLPLLRGPHPVGEVHPYDADWAPLLDGGRGVPDAAPGA